MGSVGQRSQGLPLTSPSLWPVSPGVEEPLSSPASHPRYESSAARSRTCSLVPRLLRYSQLESSGNMLTSFPGPPLQQGREPGNEFTRATLRGSEISLVPRLLPTNSLGTRLNVKLHYLPHIFKLTSFQSPLDEPGNEDKH